jgi:ubiquinone biosynthesis UbiH/UbiF/VisC/COQ6 family hydroxylase
VWDTLDTARIAPIREMRVWGDDGRAQLKFDAYETGVPELGFIAESRLMQDGLWRALQALDNVELVCPASCAALERSDHAASLTLEDGRVLQAQLVVGADGGDSWVRRQAGIGVTTLPYEQLGIVANFETEKPHDGIARQWFMPDGILAWLPLPGQRISIVWSASEARAKDLLEMDGEEFCSVVAQAGHDDLGALRLITPPVGFPLRLQHNETLIAPRLALVGDAAHRVHPLAGHGVNLGFRDVQVLASVLLAKGARADFGDYLLLRRFERARKADILAMQGVTYGLQKLFNNDDPLLGWLRNTGLGVVDRIAPLKRRLMAHAIV